MDNSNQFNYPAFIKHEGEIFSIYFPTLFADYGWEYPLARGETESIAVRNAKKELAFHLAGILYDNDELPKPTSINPDDLSPEMKVIDVETSFAPFADEIQEHLKGRHWHFAYYDKKTNEIIIEAIGFRNNQDTWDIIFEEIENCAEAKFPVSFTAKSWTEAEKRFNRIVENVICNGVD